MKICYRFQLYSYEFSIIEHGRFLRFLKHLSFWIVSCFNV
jgi:hypothetical protein